MKDKDWIIYGSKLSPFTLKVIAMCRFKGLPFQLFPDEGNSFGNMKIQLRKDRLIRGQLPLTYPIKTEENEFPLVPFLFGPSDENLYDSSAIAHWLDDEAILPFKRSRLRPNDNSAVHFVINLIDEYADEFGLYMVHHNRWKISAKGNNAGDRLSKEMPVLAMPVRRLINTFFSERQVRRLPYLFSIAEEGFHIEGVNNERQPPSRTGFPETHRLLEEAFEKLMQALEPIFTQRAYLLGERATLADMSLYGQLGMNLTDPEAYDWMKMLAPNTVVWLERMHQGSFIRHRSEGKLVLYEDLAPLLHEVCRVFVPLMQQNYAAYEHYKTQGETVFNEAAFDQGKSLYSGTLDGLPFKSVAKSFQAKVWQNLHEQWNALPEIEKMDLATILPERHGLDQLS